MPLKAFFNEIRKPLKAEAREENVPYLHYAGG